MVPLGMWTMAGWLDTELDQRTCDGRNGIWEFYT
jgi:hypothetical protein